MPLPTRDEALALLYEEIETDYTRKHSLATEAILRALARRLDHDEDLWGITGLLHDLDLERVDADPKVHGRETVNMLKERFDYPEEGLQAILAHNGDELGVACRSPLDFALSAGESITGLIFATALIVPTKKVRDVKVKSVKKRMKEKRFAAKVSRERIRLFEQMPLEPGEFYSISLEAMQGIGDELGI